MTTKLLLNMYIIKNITIDYYSFRIRSLIPKLVVHSSFLPVRIKSVFVHFLSLREYHGFNLKKSQLSNLNVHIDYFLSQV